MRRGRPCRACPSPAPVRLSAPSSPPRRGRRGERRTRRPCVPGSPCLPGVVAAGVVVLGGVLVARPESLEQLVGVPAVDVDELGEDLLRGEATAGDCEVPADRRGVTLDHAHRITSSTGTGLAWPSSPCLR